MFLRRTSQKSLPLVSLGYQPVGTCTVMATVCGALPFQAGCAAAFEIAITVEPYSHTLREI